MADTTAKTKVAPKDMKWGVDEEPEIYIPKDLPRKELADVVAYIRKEHKDLDTKACWRLAFEAIPRRYFFTPHNNKICWREKACYDSLYIWLARGEREANEPKPSFLQRLKKSIGIEK